MPGSLITDKERLRALAATGLLDTPPEETFDRLTRLATRLLDVPVALVSLVDSDRQFFKSSCGLPEPWASERETPLSHSFCQHVVTSGEPLIVEDARASELLKDNLAIPDLGVVAYAGLPLTTSEGTVLGSFCAIDGQAREWSEEDLSILRDLTDAAHTEIRLRETLQDLRQSEARLQDVLDHSHDLIQSTGADGILTYVNQAWKDTLGYTPEEAVGLPVWDVIHPDSMDHCGAVFGRVLGGEEVEDFEATLITKDGDRVEVLGTASCRFEEGRPVATRTFFRDVTRRRATEKALRESEAHYRQLVENASDLIYRTDERGFFSYANPTALETIGYSMEELRELRWLELVHPSHRDELRDLYLEQATTETETLYRELPVITKDGREVWVGQYVSLEFRNGRVVGAQAVARNITRRRELDRMKAEFVSMVSHELRTPLTSIRGALGLVVGGVTGDLPDKARELLDVALKNSERLSRLINDILDLERIESGRIDLSLQVVDPSDVVQRSAAEMGAMATDAGVELSTDSPPAPLPGVRADPDRIVQTLTNLLSNAIKFSPEGSRVTVGVEEADGEVRFRVSDRGRGIPRDAHEKIFLRFQQVDASDSREKGGTGLGLPICKSIIEGHGGRIWVESRPGEGSTFFFTLPMAAPAMERGAEQTRPGSEAGTGEGGILVCEDDAWLRKIVREILETRGYRVTEASDGQEALDLIAREKPALILLDLDLPGTDGWSVLDALTADPETRNLPVVIFSGSSPPKGPSVPEQAVEWLVKPAGARELARAVEAASRRSREPLVLVVEDDEDLGRLLVEVLHNRGMEAVLATSGKEGLEILRDRPPGLVVLDLMLPDMHGAKILEAIRGQGPPEIPVIVFTGQNLDPDEREDLEVPPDRIAQKTRVSLQDLATRIDALLSTP